MDNIKELLKDFTSEELLALIMLVEEIKEKETEKDEEL